MRSAQKRKARSLILKPMKSDYVHYRYYISSKGALMFTVQRQSLGAEPRQLVARSGIMQSAVHGTV